jgi:hypothetical protein
MSSSKTKDDAERRAEEVVQLKVIERRTSVYGRVSVGEVMFGPQWNADSDAEGAIKVIATAIRAAVADAVEGRDRIMTDLLCESEAAQEMWRLGAEAMREVVGKEVMVIWTHWSAYQEQCSNLSEIILQMAIPQPPSQTASGEVLKPSRVAMERDRYMKALEEIASIEPDHVIDWTAKTQRIARAALADSPT